MFGKHHSVAKLVKDEIPSIVTIKCSSHSAHLVSSKASKKLPQELETCLRRVCNYFSISTRRRRDFKKFQEFADAAKHIILSPAVTRWLGMRDCVSRVKEQYDPLKLYFTAELFDDPDDPDLNQIVTTLNDPTTMVYLQFLEYALGIMVEFNTIHQQESPQAHNLPKRVNELIRDLANNFMHPNYVRNTQASCLDPNLSSQWVPLGKIYLGNRLSFTF